MASRLTAAGTALALSGGLLVALGSPALAANCTAAQLIPRVLASTVTEGLSTYTPLIRGKSAVVRFYLAQPTCTVTTSQSITINSATLAVSLGGAAPTSVSAQTPVVATKLTQRTTPGVNNAADPKFLVPGSMLRPANPNVSTPATFTATINYTRKNGTTTTASTLLPAPLTATVNQQTNGLRILAVPLGDAAKTNQFSAAAQTALNSSMATLGRIYPVPDGVGPLNSTAEPAEGIRYNLAGLMDLTGLKDASGKNLIDANGKICIDNPTFNTIKANLLNTLSAWNAANPGPADIVVGVVDKAIFRATGCSTGLAAVGQPVAMAEMIPDVSGAPSPSGVIMAMEMAHSQGDIPTTSSRMSATNAYHSPNTSADKLTNRAYNVLSGAFLASPSGNFSVMNYSGGGSNNNTALFEQGDWLYLSCKLGKDPGAECTEPNVVGAPAGNDPVYFIAGVTDGTVAGTSVEGSYFVDAGLETEIGPANSPYHLRFTDGAAQLGDVRVAVAVPQTDHGEPTPTESPLGVFRASVKFPTSATQVQLLNGTTVLFTRNRSQIAGVDQPPTVAGTTKLMFTLPTTARPAGAIQVLNDDATLMVLDLRGGKLRIQSLTGGGQATVDLPSDVSIIVAAAWAPDGRTLYFTGEHMFNGQDTLLYGVPIDPTKPLDDPTFFGTPTKLQESLDLHEFESLTVSPDGATLAIEYSHFDDDLQLQLASIVTTSASVPNAPLVPLLTDVTTPGGDYTDYRKPAWSHLAGTSKLAYMRRSFTNCAGCPNTIEILTYNFVTDTTTTVVPPGNDVGSSDDPLAYAPTGFIAYIDEGTRATVVPDDSGPAVTYPFEQVFDVSLVGAQIAISEFHSCPDEICVGVHVGPVEPSLTTVVSAPLGTNLSRVTLDVYARCGTTMVPVAVGQPTGATGSGSASVRVRLPDTSQVCGAGSGDVPLTVVASDGFLRSSPDAPGAGTNAASGMKPPQPGIVAPTAGIVASTTAPTFLPSEAIPFVGNALDPQDGALTGPALAWTLDGNPVGSGTSGLVTGAAPGLHELRLTATNSLGVSASTTVSVRVIADGNGDGIPDADTAECGAVDASADANGDGVTNGDSIALFGSACTRASSYGGDASFAPNPFNALSVLGLLDVPPATVSLTVPRANLNLINPDSVTLRVGDRGPEAACPQYVAPVAAPLIGGLFQKKWNPSGSTAQARFDQRGLALWVAFTCSARGTLPITVSGISTDGKWSFTATGTLVVIQPRLGL